MGGFLASFLEDHSTGSLRGMNPLGGGPAHEGAVRWGRSSVLVEGQTEEALVRDGSRTGGPRSRRRPHVDDRHDLRHARWRPPGRRRLEAPRRSPAPSARRRPFPPDRTPHRLRPVPGGAPGRDAGEQHRASEDSRGCLARALPGPPFQAPSSCSTRSRRSSSRRSTPTRGEGLLPEPALNEPRDVIGRAGGPELVDDGPGTAPSERLERADPNCSRTVTGPLPIAEAGLGAVLERCPVFAAW